MINKLVANLTNGQTVQSLESPAKQIVSKVDLLSIESRFWKTTKVDLVLQFNGSPLSMKNLCVKFEVQSNPHPFALYLAV